MFDHLQLEQLFQENKYKYQKLIEENISLKQEVQFLKSQIQEMTKKMDDKIHFIKQTEQQLSNQTSQQYEITISRQLTIIEQLIIDKKELQQEQINLANEIKKINSFYSQEIDKLTQQHNQEKQQIIQKEKNLRKEWEKHKIQEIKQQTILGLEPEIQKIIKKYQEEIAILRLQLEEK